LEFLNPAMGKADNAHKSGIGRAYPVSALTLGLFSLPGSNLHPHIPSGSGDVAEDAFRFQGGFRFTEDWGFGRADQGLHI